MGLTPAQERVYRFIQDYVQETGHSPSYEEIRNHLGFRSLNSVYKHLKQLEQRGYLTSPWKNRKRAFDLQDPQTSRVATIPFLGVVMAGEPVEAVEVPETLDIPEDFLGSGENFALRVRGDSMILEGIREGDILIVTRRSSAANGQTVVAQVDGEATVKKFFRCNGEVELRPAHPTMESIRAAAEQVEIVGVVVGLLRHYR